MPFRCPAPMGWRTANGIAQFIGSWSNPSSLDSTSVRFDHVVNDKLRLFFRFSDTASSSAARQTSLPVSRTPTNEQHSAYTMRTTRRALAAFSQVASVTISVSITASNTTSTNVTRCVRGQYARQSGAAYGLGPGSSPSFVFIWWIRFWSWAGSEFRRSEAVEPGGHGESLFGAPPIQIWRGLSQTGAVCGSG